LLPGIHRALGGALQTVLAQAAEAPLFDAEQTEESFIDRLLPDGAPAHWLRWLFYAMGADAYWREDYDDTRRRLILRRIFELYRSRGTVDGLGLHVNLLADATLVRAVQPPARLFLLPSLTQAERAALETHYPEVRLRPFNQPGLRRSAFVGDVPRAHTFPAVTDAVERVGESAVLYDPTTGIETPLQRATVEGEGLVVRLARRGHAAGMMCGRPLAGATVDEGAASRLYTFALQAGTIDPLLARASIGAQPGLLPVRVWWTDHREPGHGRGSFLRNRWLDVYQDRGGAALPTIPMRRDAEARIWKSFALFDPAVAPTVTRQAAIYLDGARIGRVSPHIMEASIHAPGRRPRAVVWPGVIGATNGCVAASDAPARIERMRWAGNLARRAGCRIPVAIRTRRPLVSDPALLCGRAVTNDSQEVI
jgi:hypothetical protein